MSKTAVQSGDPRPLVLHVLYRFDTGGLENGVVNLLNHLPADQFRHAVLAIDQVVPAFAARLQRDDIRVFALHKPPGHALKLYPRIWQLLRELRPTIIHTRNLAALETQLVAAVAGVPVRIHSEHGRDVEDLEGSNNRLQRIRRLYSPFVHRYVTVSRELQGYLVGRVGIRPERVRQIYNGVDIEKFRPSNHDHARIPGCPFGGPGLFLVGTVGRMQAVKNQTLLARAFVHARETNPSLTQALRLVLVGDGPLRAEAQAIVDAADLGAHAWLPGERRDVHEVMRGLGAYVLPSLSEGISNTILEAMATGLPVIATHVGGNPELVVQDETGELVPSQDVGALAAALVRAIGNPMRTAAMSRQARAQAEQRFSLTAMVKAYADLYHQEILAPGGP
jgi:sugar transferase (PEP-CTERM/EpsH1 system associated)